MSDAELIHVKQIILSVDLNFIFERLIKTQGWSESETAEAIKQYRRYLFLRKKYPNYNLPPSKEIDEVWHEHILHTTSYREFCALAFNDRPGSYLDHHPYPAKSEGNNETTNRFELTQELYYKEFGEYIYQITGQSFKRKFLNIIKHLPSRRFSQRVEELER